MDIDEERMDAKKQTGSADDNIHTEYSRTTGQFTEVICRLNNYVRTSQGIFMPKFRIQPISETSTVLEERARAELYSKSATEILVAQAQLYIQAPSSIFSGLKQPTIGDLAGNIQRDFLRGINGEGMYFSQEEIKALFAPLYSKAILEVSKDDRRKDWNNRAVGWYLLDTR